MPNLTKAEYPEKWIPVNKLSVVWAKSQRLLNEGHVKRIMDGFDPDAIGTITVTLPNGNGIHHIIDGQHRVEAVRRLLGSDQRVPCRVLEARDPKQAAHIWVEQNVNRKSATQIDNFKIMVQAGIQPHVEVDGLIRGHGYTIAASGGEGTIRAVNACLKVRKRYGIVALKLTFETIQSCWQMDKDSTHQGIIGGFGEIFGRFKGEVDRTRLIMKVAKKYTPISLVAKARARRDINRQSLPENVAAVLLDAYNSGLQKNRLERAA